MAMFDEQEEREAFERTFQFYNFEVFPDGKYRILQTQDSYDAFKAGIDWRAQSAPKAVTREELVDILSSAMAAQFGWSDYDSKEELALADALIAADIVRVKETDNV
jgi:hypothetical protein